MRLFFDNNMPPIVTETRGGYVRHLGHAAHHIMDLPCGRNAADLDWIALLAGTGKDWIVFTGDLRIARNKPEQVAFQRAGLFGFALAPGFQLKSMPVNQMAAALILRRPEIEKVISVMARTGLYEIPVRSGGFRPLL